MHPSRQTSMQLQTSRCPASGLTTLAARIARSSFQRGLTLIELAIVLAIAGVLTTMAWPAWQPQVFKVRRLEAVAELQRLSLAQERWRATNPAYTHNVGRVAGLELTQVPLGTSYTSSSGHYVISVQTTPATAAHSYVATAVGQGMMAGDRHCQSLTLRVEGGTVSYSAVPVAHAQRCWGR